MKVGYTASVHGSNADKIKGMADSLGPNNPALANKLYAVSAELRAWAKHNAKEYGRFQKMMAEAAVTTTEGETDGPRD